MRIFDGLPEETRRDFPTNGAETLDVKQSFCTGTERQLKLLIAFAAQAPSGHNAQPWLFRVRDGQIDLLSDWSRMIHIADTDRREMYVSLGCALENLLIAAEQLGLGHEVAYFPDQVNDPALVARVSFEPGGEPSAFRSPVLFSMIAERHTNRRPYDARPVPSDQLDLLGGCVVEGGVVVDFVANSAERRVLDSLVLQADHDQFADDAYRQELSEWTSRGSFGEPWLRAHLHGMLIRRFGNVDNQARRDEDLLRSAPMFGVVSTAGNSRTLQVMAGQAFQRLWLMATALGIQIHPMTRVLQVAPLKDELRDLIDGGNLYPQQTFRMGYAHSDAHQVKRRPVEELIVKE